jgi:hypothetical protein
VLLATSLIYIVLGVASVVVLRLLARAPLAPSAPEGG